MTTARHLLLEATICNTGAKRRSRFRPFLKRECCKIVPGQAGPLVGYAAPPVGEAFPGIVRAYLAQIGERR